MLGAFSAKRVFRYIFYVVPGRRECFGVPRLAQPVNDIAALFVVQMCCLQKGMLFVQVYQCGIFLSFDARLGTLW